MDGRKSGGQCNPWSAEHRQRIMPNLRAEIRHAVRLLRRRPAFGLTITATIALAIAGNTVMFGLIRGILLAALPVPDSGQLVRIEQIHAAGASNVTGATFIDLRARTRSLAGVAAIRITPATFSANDQALQIAAAAVTPDYFAILRLPPVAGRLPFAADFTAGAEPVVFLSPLDLPAGVRRRSPRHRPACARQRRVPNRGRRHRRAGLDTGRR